MTLRIDNATFSYRPRPKARGPAIDSVTFEPAPGRVTALIGPNGSGKSTLLRLMLGSLRPTQCRVTLGSGDVHRLSPRARARSIAYIAQRPDAAFAYRVREVVAMGRLALGARPTEDRDAVEAALARMDLVDLADRPLPRLSVGQQQRVAIARAIAQLDRPDQSDNESNEPGPRYLLADEPVAALDPRHAVQTLSILRGLAHESLATPSPIAVVVVLHDLTAAARNADDALLLDQGRVVARGPAGEVIEPAMLERLFAVRFDQPARGVLVPGADT